MSANPPNVRPPTDEEIRAAASAHHIELTEEELADFAAMIPETLAGYERLDALSEPGPDVTYTDSNGVTRTIGGLTPFDGDAKNLDGNSIPGAPETTLSLGAEYTFEGVFGGAWDARIRGDYYYQGDSFSRVWNTTGDELESWNNLNLAVVFFNDENGLEFEIFGKNVTDEEVITGRYLTDDSSGLFSNIFLTEPRLYGVRVRKSW